MVGLLTGHYLARMHLYGMGIAETAGDGGDGALRNSDCNVHLVAFAGDFISCGRGLQSSINIRKSPFIK